jgi:hypothetical protein
MSSIKLIFKLLIIGLVLVGAYFIWQKAINAKDFFTNKEVVTQNIVLKQITAIGKLELVNFQFRDVVESELQKTLLPDSKVLLIISGEAIGCVDLTKLADNNLVFRGDSLIIALPNPEICVSKIDHSKSKVYDTSLFSLLDQSQLIDEAYKKAELQINDSALQMGILEQTKVNSDKLLIPMLEKIAGKKVRIIYREKI